VPGEGVVPASVPVPGVVPLSAFFVVVVVVVVVVLSVADWFAELMPERFVPLPLVAPLSVVPDVPAGAAPNPPKPVPVWARAPCVQTHPARRI
jgi:hypothetical protein